MPDYTASHYLSIALGLLLDPSLALAEGVPPACSPQEAQNGEVASVTSKTWRGLHAILVRFGHCDDGGIAKGFSDSVPPLLAGKHGRLRELAEFCTNDCSFQRFVVRHPDETLADDVVVQALKNVREGYPAGRYGLCWDQECGLEQSGAAQADRTSIVVESHPSADDRDAPAAARTVVATASKPLRVQVRDCDPFHFYFDGAEVTKWRR